MLNSFKLERSTNLVPYIHFHYTLFQERVTSALFFPTLSTLSVLSDRCHKNVWACLSNRKPPSLLHLLSTVRKVASSSAREMALVKFTGRAFLVQSKWAIRRCHQFQCMPVATETEVERLFSRILLNI